MREKPIPQLTEIFDYYINSQIFNRFLLASTGTAFIVQFIFLLEKGMGISKIRYAKRKLFR